MLELDASIRGGEAQVDTDGLSIAFGLPSSHFVFQFGARADATIQTLLVEHREFDLGNVQPTAVLGGEMQFQLLDQASRLRRLKHLIQGCQGMRVQVIHDQHQLLIPISILCSKIKERKICSYTMWKGMNIKHGTSNHTSGLPSVGG